jgi:hypothetical protein
LYTKIQQQNIENQRKSDALLDYYFRRIMLEADSILLQQPIFYQLDGRGVLIETSRQLANRMVVLGMAWRHKGLPKYKEAMIRDLKLAAAFPDWNPKHFLDVGEMCSGFGIGLDWLGDEIKGEDRRQIVEGLLKNGIRPYLWAHDPANPARPYWASVSHNWNIVCSTGPALASIACYEDFPKEAASTLEFLLHKLPRSIEQYAPDGNWFEGPMYWEYATQNLVLALASLESAFGSDLGLGNPACLQKSGATYVAMQSPSGRLYNYADARTQKPTVQPMSLWFARRYQDTLSQNFYFSQLEKEKVRLEKGGKLTESQPYLPLLLAYYPEKRWPKTRIQQAKIQHIKGAVEIITLNGNPGSTDGIFLAAKGGDNNLTHQQLDLGSFIVEAGGLNWCVEMGPDYYGLPGYWSTGKGGGRWKYLRNRNHSQSTLVIDDSIQNPLATASVGAIQPTGNQPFASINLSSAYENQLKLAKRTFRLLDEKTLEISDELEGLKPGAEVKWNWILPKEVEVLIKGKTVELKQAMQKMEITNLGDGMTWTLESLDPKNTLEMKNEAFALLAAKGRTKETGKMSILVQVKWLGKSNEKP